MSQTGHDPIRDAWHPLAAIEQIETTSLPTLLLDRQIEIRRDASFGWDARRPDTGAALPVIERHGVVWTSLGQPNRDLFAIPEYLDPDRRNLSAGPIGVATSAPRAWT